MTQEAQTPAPNSDEMRHIVNDIDQLMSNVGVNRVIRLSFHLNDIQYHVTLKKPSDTDESLVYIQTVLGYLPFSIDANEKRQAILLILSASHKLFHVRFGLDHSGRIFAAAKYSTDEIRSPHFMFYPLTCFLQEALPFIELIGKYI